MDGGQRQDYIGYHNTHRINKRQNGQRFKPSNAKFYTLTAQDKHGILINGQIRKLTPLECERLQTLPDYYTDINGITDGNRIKAIGNGLDSRCNSTYISRIKGGCLMLYKYYLKARVPGHNLVDL